MRLLPFDYGVRNLGRSAHGWLHHTGQRARGVAHDHRSVLRERYGQVPCQQSHRTTSFSWPTGSEESLERSQIPGSAAGGRCGQPSGVKSRLGVPYVSPEIHAAIIVKGDKKSAENWHAVVRGFIPEALLVHPSASVIQGRMPNPAMMRSW